MSNVDSFVFGTGTETPVTSQRQLSLLPITNFLGGLNLSVNDAQLADNESGDLCNIDVTTSGLCRRHPVRLHTRQDLPAQICNMSQWQDEDGNPSLYLVLTDGTVWSVEGGAPSTATPVLEPITIANPEQCEMIQIGFTQYFYGNDNDAIAVEGGPPSQGGTVSTVPWQTIDGVPAFDNGCEGRLIAVGCDEGGNPDFTDEKEFELGFPQARCMAIHADFAWAANVTDPDTGEVHCNRVYRSFPLTGQASTGQAWESGGYIDIDPGDGDCITNLLPCGPNLYVFKHNSVYLIQGWDDPSADNLVSVQICGDAGTPTCKTAVCCGCLVYFWDESRGLYRINGTNLEHVFRKLEPLIQQGCIRRNCEPAIGCCNGRIFLSVPEFPVTLEEEEMVQETPPCTNNTTYVLTPETETWTKYTYGMDCYMSWRPRAEKPRCLAASSRGGNFSVVEIERPGYQNYGLDVFSDTADAEFIESFWRSRWFDAGNMWSTKQWCAPQFVAQAAPPQRTSFEPPRDFEIQTTYLSDWCPEVSIGGGMVPFFQELEREAPEPELELVYPGGEVQQVCPEPITLSDSSCPISNNKKQKQCGPTVTDTSCSMQLLVTGPGNKPWCICGILIAFTEEPFSC